MIATYLRKLLSQMIATYLRKLFSQPKKMLQYIEADERKQAGFAQLGRFINQTIMMYRTWTFVQLRRGSDWVLIQHQTNNKLHK